MQSDFYLSRVRGENDGPDILRVDNCSEVDVAGNFYKQDGKYYDDCCDLENEDAPECADSPWWAWLILSLFLMPWVLMGSYAIFRFFFMPLFCWIFRFCVKHCPEFICYNICCARCEPQPIDSNDSNATRSRTESIDNISTISANIRQPPSRPPSPSAPPSSSSDIQEGLFDRLPRSKASEDQCTGRSKYFFSNL